MTVGGGLKFKLKSKIPVPKGARGLRLFHMLDSSGNFTGTQTPGTNVHMARGTVHNRLDPLDIGLPSAVGPAVGVGNLDAKGNTLVAKLTFSHPLHLLAVRAELGQPSGPV